VLGSTRLEDAFDYAIGVIPLPDYLIPMKRFAMLTVKPRLLPARLGLGLGWLRVMHTTLADTGSVRQGDAVFVGGCGRL